MPRMKQSSEYKDAYPIKLIILSSSVGILYRRFVIRSLLGNINL